MDRRSKLSRKDRSGHSTDITLVCMPFCDLTTPAIGISLLKQVVAPLGLTTELLYLNLLFARRVGVDSYNCIQTVGLDCLVGDWIFSEGAVPPSPASDTEYVQRILRGKTSAFGELVKPVSQRSIRTILKVRRAVPAFLEECVGRVMRLRPRIVGFSSVYQQQTASLSLAKRLKEHSPGTFIIFGGANCEGQMGLEIVRQFSFVDAVVSGEGEMVFPEVVQRVLGNQPLSGIQGVYKRKENVAYGKDERCRNAPICRNMDPLPFPLYDDYFEQLEVSGIALPRRDRQIVLETSRGCWWAEKGRCAFCGLNGESMIYRCKSSDRAQEELRFMTERYAAGTVAMGDNVLNPAYFEDFIPALASQPTGVRIFYEARANLEKEQIQALRNAGVCCVQPGIESLSTPILKLMRKRTAALQNIQFLKWCREFGIMPGWNMLTGFPGEPPDEYEHMARLIPLIVHLRPPIWVGCIRVDRFSPYFENPTAYGFIDIAPIPAYNYIYSLDPEALANLAYYFSYKYQSPQEVETYFKPLRDQIDRWLRQHESSDFFHLDNGEELTVWDQRPMASEFLTVLTGLQRILYLACDSAKSLSRLQREVEFSLNGKFSREEVEEILGSLVDRSLMIREGNFFLSLAIPVGDYRPLPKAWDRFQTFLKKRAEAARQETFMEKVRMKEISMDQRVSSGELATAMRNRLEKGR